MAFAVGLAAVIPATMTGQNFHNNTEKTMKCNDSGNRGDEDRARFCDIREYPGGSVSKFTVDPGGNGGIQIKGWDRSDTLVRAKVETWAPTESEAKGLAGQVNVQAGGGNITASAPDFGDRRGWAVSYEIFVPHRTGLELTAHNGGISVADVTGDIHFSTTNGGVSLARLGGNVVGSTKNGGLKVELEGSRWDGTQLDLTTTNGGVNLTLPGSYSAHLETSTVNGGVNVDLPMTVTGNLKPGREINADIGSGGPTLRLKTTNGGIRIQRKA